MKPSFILYVSDQQAAAAFYRAVLACEPVLDVPGMTEFPLGEGATLGLMPAAGIKKLLGESLPEPAVGVERAKTELYVEVPDPAACHARALAAGATELSALAPRDWGHDVAYSLDADGHVLAFAKPRT